MHILCFTKSPKLRITGSHIKHWCDQPWLAAGLQLKNGPDMGSFLTSGPFLRCALIYVVANTLQQFKLQTNYIPQKFFLGELYNDFSYSC